MSPVLEVVEFRCALVIGMRRPGAYPTHRDDAAMNGPPRDVVVGMSGPRASLEIFWNIKIRQTVAE
jgi:hypothetical protein